MIGTVKTPFWIPATWKQGIAQLDGIRPVTSGTIAWMRPIIIGSMLFRDRAAIFAEEFFCHSCRDFREGGDEAVAGEGEILFELAALDLARDALDVVEAVEGFAYSAQADEPARFQDARRSARRSGCRWR